jgi:hypothetical protein
MKTVGDFFGDFLCRMTEVNRPEFGEPRHLARLAPCV